ncbi:MAG: redoxin domain-containing protein [Ardenticatenaceae bacterium]|nr:redoxin domain-containing protein [Ardenticatenaceae bacterium]
MTGLLDKPIVRMPELVGELWLNGERPFTRQTLRGQVVLIDFWDYACVNCIRTLPYLREWHKRYAHKGLVVIGIHTPEFKFAQLQPQVQTAVTEHQISYPILLDNQYENWSRFAIKAWPTKILIDAHGYIRYQRQGEGYYRETELAIQTLLRQRDANVVLPDLLPPLREEDAPGAVCYRPTPELYAGYQGGGLFGGGLGNPEGYVPQNPMFYKLPEKRPIGQFYVEGVWRAWPEALAYAGQEGGRIVLPYSAATVNAVLSPSADSVELMLDLRPSAAEPVVVVQQDGRYLTPANAGPDIEFADDGISFVRITRARMVQLVNNNSYESHELNLTFQATGLCLYAFTFTSCVAPYATPDHPDTFQVH